MEYSRWCVHASIKNMDRIQGFKLFMRVVDMGSFSKAANEMGMSQSSATKQVAQLEARLGTRLLHRSTHGVTPTEIGLLFYEKCKIITYHIDEADSAAALMHSQVQGSLRISTSVAFGRRVLAPLVMDFMRAHPKLHVELNFEDRYVNLVEQGVDVAIRMGPLADSTLGSRYLGLNPWVLVASPIYLASRGVPKVPQDLTQHTALIYSTVGEIQGGCLLAPMGSTKWSMCKAHCVQTICRPFSRQQGKAWALPHCRGMSLTPQSSQGRSRRCSRIGRCLLKKFMRCFHRRAGCLPR